jgi:hypothetical protein
MNTFARLLCQVSLGLQLYGVTRHLLLAQLAGVWVTAMRVIGSLSVVIWAGVALGLITGRMAWQEISVCLEWYAYSIVLFTSILTFALGILQSSYYFMKSTILSLFVGPQFLLLLLQPVIIVAKYDYDVTET